MFPSGHFPGAYFTEGYFPRAEVVAAEANHFPHGYFAEGHYPDSYFPGHEPEAAEGAKPLYFAHRYFTLGCFPDSYFPGQDGAADVVQPPVAIGGGDHRHARPAVVRAWVRVDLPAFELDLRGRSVPARMVGRIGSDYRVEAQVQGASTPAVMQARSFEADLPAFTVAVDGTSTPPRRKRLNDDDELVEHYMLSVGGSGKD